MVHNELLDHPLEELLERIWRYHEDGSLSLRAVLEDSAVDDPEQVLGQLAELSLVRVDDGELTLLPAGADRARTVVRRNRLAERLLSDVLDVPLAESERTACLMEHVLSPAVTDAVCAFLGHPPTCPHGKPIPPGDCCKDKGNGALRPVVLPLSELEPGHAARIVFISAGLDKRLERLGSFGVVPGTAIRLRQKRPSFVLEIGGTSLALEREVAGDIYVRREV
jgi:DtxR family Mn-dependent transcriptional regulator